MRLQAERFRGIMVPPGRGTVIFETPDKLTPEKQEMATEALEQRLPGKRVLILPGGMRYVGMIR